jgi:segregation and condensation protein A
MATAVSAPVRLDGYQLRLSSFEGPLDVLLRLIEREQLPVNEISLVAVLDQFLSYMDVLGHLPAETIAEFAAVACRLSVLKSRALLPRPAKTDDETEVLDLVKQLEEYRAIKTAAEHLAVRQRIGIGAFGPGVGITLPLPEPPRLVPQPASTLSKAVGRWIARLPRQPTPLRSVRTVSLREMISRVFQALSNGHSLAFDTLRSECQSRHELAVAFLALLVLMRRQLVVAQQVALFGPITLTRCGQEQSAVPILDVMGSKEADGPDKLFA